MNILINGESRKIASAKNIAELVVDLALLPETCLIEHNHLALHRSEWAGRHLKEGDQIEILQIVAGG